MRKIVITFYSKESTRTISTTLDKVVKKLEPIVISSPKLDEAIDWQITKA